MPVQIVSPKKIDALDEISKYASIAGSLSSIGGMGGAKDTSKISDNDLAALDKEKQDQVAAMGPHESNNPDPMGRKLEGMSVTSTGPAPIQKMSDVPGMESDPMKRKLKRFSGY